MGTCEDVRELLSAALDGELPAETHAAVEAHVAACPRCADERQHLAEVRSLLRALPARQAPEPVRAELIATARAREATSRTRQLAVAAVLVAAVVAGGAVGVTAGGDRGVPVPVDELVAEHLAISTPAPDAVSAQR